MKIPLPELGLDCEKKELKDCPFCGYQPENDNRTTVHSETEKISVNFGFFCRKCGVSKGCYPTERKAIDAWNTRTSENQKAVLVIDEEKLRLELIPLIAQLVCEWEIRPRFGEGSDRSDLIIKFTKDLSQNAKSFIKICPAGKER